MQPCRCLKATAEHEVYPSIILADRAWAVSPHFDALGEAMTEDPSTDSSKSEASVAPMTRRQAAAARGLSMAQVDRMVSQRAISPAQIAAMPEPLLSRMTQRIQFQDLPAARERFRLLHLQGVGGLQVPGRRLRAIQHQDRLRAQTARAAGARSRVAGVPVGVVPAPSALAQPVGDVEGHNWSALGPANIGGRTRSIVIDPDNPDTMWAASAGGGIWRTENGGLKWTPVDDLMANLAVCCLAVDPTDRKTIYAGTGEGFSNFDAIRGAGIFWTNTNTNNRWLQIGSTAGFKAVNRLAVSADGKVVLAATPDGLLRSADPSRATWATVIDEAIADVKFHPHDPALAVAGGLGSGRAYYSSDGAKTWTPSNRNRPRGRRVELTYAVKDPRVVYASADLNSGTIWRSQDGGRTYELMDTLTRDSEPANYLADQGWYGNTIWAGDPSNENVLLVGGRDMWRSNDGGNTLSQINSGLNRGSAHSDQHCIVSHPRLGQGGNKTVIFGTDGGVYKTDDYTAVGNDSDHVHGWSALEQSYAVTQFYGGAGNVNTGVIVGGAQDNGFLCYTPANSQQWSVIVGWDVGGDGGWCAADPQDPNYFYGEYIFLRIQRSHDGGRTAEYICGLYYDATKKNWLWRPAPYLIPDAKQNQALFIAPFVLDPNNANRIIGGGMSLWRTDDAKTPNDDRALTGPTWTSIKSSIGQEISSLAIAPGDSDTVWVGHVSGDIFRTHGATGAFPQWDKVGDRGPKPLSVRRYCSSFMIDPTNKQIVYVTFASYRDGQPGSNVWKTEDDGQTWDDIGLGLPDAPVSKLTMHPSRQGYLYLGTEIGLFASEDGGNNWSPTNEGPTNCPVYDLFWMNNFLVCATHGRGMFKIQL
jgi:photosystem II stability/assembly factor-like uncharacterized protein